MRTRKIPTVVRNWFFTFYFFIESRARTDHVLRLQRTASEYIIVFFKSRHDPRTHAGMRRHTFEPILKPNQILMGI